MRKTLRIIAAATFTLVVSSAIANSTERYVTYYSDSAFQNYVGEDDYPCDDSHYVSGTTGPYQIVDIYSCSTGAHLHHECFEDINGTLTPITCP